MSWTKVEAGFEVEATEVEVTPAERLEASEKPNMETMVKPKKAKPKADMVNHPPHYTSHPSGVECIQITEHMGFNLGNALKYIWRADLKGSAVEDLEKAVFYINRELVKRRTK